jgi:hypothetical protein
MSHPFHRWQISCKTVTIVPVSTISFRADFCFSNQRAISTAKAPRGRTAECTDQEMRAAIDSENYPHAVARGVQA